MLINRKIAEIYLEARQNRKKLVSFFKSQYPSETDEHISWNVANWLKQFNHHWSRIKGTRRFFERESEWLKRLFQWKYPAARQAPSASEEVSPTCPTQNATDKIEINTPTTSRRGIRCKAFEDLAESTKKRKCHEMANEQPFEMLIRSAETAARNCGSLGVAKVLKGLREGGEDWAKAALNALDKYVPESNPSAEFSLLIKTTFGLSKRKYEGIAKSVKDNLGTKVLQPWSKIVELRNTIIPAFSAPNWDKGYLSSQVTVRDLVVTDVGRLLELPEVEDAIEHLGDAEVNCLFHLSGGVDSATGFTHYNQKGIMGKDDSLLSEHVMPLLLSSVNQELWRNPNPQSDRTCRIRSMNWVKETDNVTKQMFQAFMCEVEAINSDPIELQTRRGTKLRIQIEAYYTLIDGKAANAIVGNKNTHACPSCFKNDELSTFIETCKLGPSYHHSRLNGLEWFIRNAAKNSVEGHPAQSHPEVKARAREIANQLEAYFHVNVNRPKPGGSGSSNNGNMARRLLSDPEKLAEILNVNKDMIINFRTISCLAVSSRKLDPQKCAELYTLLQKQVLEEFKFVTRLPPCIHKYQHLAEFVERLPFPMNFVDEQAGEKCHKRYKFSRPHLSRKTSGEDQLSDMMRDALAWSDLKMADPLVRTEGPRQTGYKDKQFDKLLEKFCRDSHADSDDFDSESDSTDSDDDS